eukprot:GHVL01039288.1.p1 GENE.GHVL01039288.1~~GHVL01039288.1.p1  ORF type:complete len:343 (+),score=58.65 GHVL01039288.1:36-1064(+)
MIKEALKSLSHGNDLSFDEMEGAINEIVESTMTDDIVAQTASLLSMLKLKGETSNEIYGFVRSLLKHSVKLEGVKNHSELVDIVGTGGDMSNTVNISTGATILAAACGVKMAKHGNRAVSSSCGSADVLEAMGVRVDLSPEAVCSCINEIGIGFCYAPAFHPCLGRLYKIRRSLGFPTILNLIGPLMNPSGATHHLIGVAHPAMLQKFAEVLLHLECGHSIVFHGAGGLDELSPIGKAHGFEILNGKILKFEIDPEEFGMPICTVDDLKGLDKETNAKLLLDQFQEGNGPIGDCLILNAAVAVYLSGSCENIASGVDVAREALRSSAALKKINEWKHFIENC